MIFELHLPEERRMFKVNTSEDITFSEILERMIESGLIDSKEYIAVDAERQRILPVDISLRKSGIVAGNRVIVYGKEEENII